MSLLNLIKADQLETRKKNPEAKAKIALLTTLIGEASMIGKNDGNRETTDTEVVGVVKKFSDKINEFLGANIDEDRRVALMLELEVLSKYMPKQLTIAEMHDKIGALQVTTPAKLNLGVIMKHFKANYAGQYDGAALKTVAEQFIRDNQ